MTDPTLWVPGEELRLAVIGLGSSHPARDISALRRLAARAGSACSVSMVPVSDEDPSSVEGVVASLDQAMSEAPHIAIVTCRSPAVPDAVAAALHSGAVVWVNKPAVVDPDDLDRLEKAVSPTPDRFLTASTLRFATSAPSQLDRSAASTVRATVRHDVRRWQAEQSDQDDRRFGGGLVGTMGIHGLELLAVAYGPEFEVRSVSCAQRHLRDIRSEDTAVITVQWHHGLIGTVEVLGRSDQPGYSLLTAEISGERRWEIGSGADEYGEHAAMAALLTMAEGAAPPVAWSESRAILGALCEAVRLAADEPLTARSRKTW